MRRALLPFGLLLFGLACNGNKVGDDTAPPEGDTDTDTDADSDTDSDADADADSDADADADSDADADADSDADVDPIGDYYAGSFQMDVAETNLINMAETCLGTVELWYSTKQDPPFQGGYTCEFQGHLATLGPQTAVLEATGEEELVGTLQMEVPHMGEYEVPWTGTFADDAIIGTGEYVETIEVHGFELMIEVYMDFEAVYTE